LNVTGSREAWRLGHRPALDGVRGIAILCVIGAHLLSRWSALGSIGVTVFFVLSGFLITALLLEELDEGGRIDLRHFYARRARRLFPAMLLMLVFVSAVLAAIGLPWLWSAVSVATYWSNWAGAAGMQRTWVEHTWSLAIEEQFYLVWPLLLLVASRRISRRWVLGMLVTGAAASAFMRAALYFAGVGPDRIYMGTDTRADALLLGCALALAMTLGFRLPRVPGGFIAGILALCLAVGAHDSSLFHDLLAPTVGAVAGIMLVGAGLGPSSLLERKALRWFGRRSYGIYLWTYPMLFIVTAFCGSHWWSWPLGTLLGITIAAASWQWLERPLLAAGRSGDPNPVDEVGPLRGVRAGVYLPNADVGGSEARRRAGDLIG
jgi:peptidoglycan/LPS O-acetylase OafA/YrhL